MAVNTIGIRSIFAAIHAAPVALRHTPREQPPTPGLFVTISRQGGAGGRTVAQLLVNRLNVLDPNDVPWTLWDRDLVEKVAADNHIARELIESLEDTSRSWVEEFLVSLAAEGNETEAQFYPRFGAKRAGGRRRARRRLHYTQYARWRSRQADRAAGVSCPAYGGAVKYLSKGGDDAYSYAR